MNQTHPAIALLVLFFNMVSIGASGCLTSVSANPISSNIQLNDRFSTISLGLYTEVFEDPQGIFTIDDVSKEPATNRFNPKLPCLGEQAKRSTTQKPEGGTVLKWPEQNPEQKMDTCF